MLRREINAQMHATFASSPRPIFILKLAGQKIGPGIHGQDLYAHALTNHQDLVNRALL